MKRTAKYERMQPLSQRQIYDEEDLHPEDGEPHIEIWITIAGWRQIDQCGHGNWYNAMTCSPKPTSRLCVQTLVPASAVENKMFYPDRTEPDLVSERCQAYAVTIAESVADGRVKRLQNLKPGDEVISKQVGYGLVSYERSGPVVEIREGRLFTETFNTIGFEWEGNNWVFDGGFGLKSTFVFREEVPAGEEIACDEDYV